MVVVTTQKICSTCITHTKQVGLGGVGVEAFALAGGQEIYTVGGEGEHPRLCVGRRADDGNSLGQHHLVRVLRVQVH